MQKINDFQTFKHIKKIKSTLKPVNFALVALQ